MNKNKKKIIGTLLGIMASISSTKAMQSVLTKDNINAGTNSNDNKNDEKNKLKKRGKTKDNIYLKILDLLIKLELSNEVASTIPGLKRYSRTLVRPYISNYRIVHGFRGYVMRHDNPKYASDVFKLSGDDGHDFRVRVNQGDDFFKSENDRQPRETSAVELTDAIGNLVNEQSKFKLSEYLSEPSINLVAEAKFRDSDKYYRLFEIKAIWNIDDVARAVGQVNKLLDIINNQKIDNDKKKQMIKNQFGKNVVFVPSSEGKNCLFRILLGKKKFTNIDVNAIVKEKFMAGELGGNVQLGLENENNVQYINDEINKLNKILNNLDQSQDLNCYAEFKLVDKNKQEH